VLHAPQQQHALFVLQHTFGLMMVHAKLEQIKSQQEQ